MGWQRIEKHLEIKNIKNKIINPIKIEELRIYSNYSKYWIKLFQEFFFSCEIEKFFLYFFFIYKFYLIFAKDKKQIIFVLFLCFYKKEKEKKLVLEKFRNIYLFYCLVERQKYSCKLKNYWRIYWRIEDFSIPCQRIEKK